MAAWVCDARDAEANAPCESVPVDELTHDGVPRGDCWYSAARSSRHRCLLLPDVDDTRAESERETERGHTKRLYRYGNGHANPREPREPEIGEIVTTVNSRSVGVAEQLSHRTHMIVGSSGAVSSLVSASISPGPSSQSKMSRSERMCAALSVAVTTAWPS